MPTWREELCDLDRAGKNYQPSCERARQRFIAHTKGSPGSCKDQKMLKYVRHTSLRPQLGGNQRKDNDGCC